MEKVLMTLEEALAIKNLVLKAKKKGMKTNLPSELKLLAGFTEGFCKRTRKKKLTKMDVEKLFKFFKEKFKETNDEYFWAGKIQCEKILENWREIYDF